MPSYQFTDESKDDLIQIRQYTIKQWGVEQSQRYLSDLRNTLRMLADNPLLGRPRDDVAKGAFSFPHQSHAIYYFTKPKGIVVFAVLHKRMLPIHHLTQRTQM